MDGRMGVVSTRIRKIKCFMDSMMSLENINTLSHYFDSIIVI